MMVQRSNTYLTRDFTYSVNFSVEKEKNYLHDGFFAS